VIHQTSISFENAAVTWKTASANHFDLLFLTPSNHKHLRLQSGDLCCGLTMFDASCCAHPALQLFATNNPKPDPQRSRLGISGSNPLPCSALGRTLLSLLFTIVLRTNQPLVLTGELLVAHTPRQRAVGSVSSACHCFRPCSRPYLKNPSN
jgi:hypothetical protein